MSGGNAFSKIINPYANSLDPGEQNVYNNHADKFKGITDIHEQKAAIDALGAKYGTEENIQKADTDQAKLVQKNRAAKMLSGAQL